MPTASTAADVLIVGSGLMGAAVAARLRAADPDLTIVMVEGGAPIGSRPGLHLHDVVEPHLWEQYNERVSSGVQGLYTGARVSADVGSTLVGASPGMYHLSSIGEDAAQMPAAAVAWNVGGMGVHWTAATPWPWGDEIPSLIPPQEWEADLADATRLLRVNAQPFAATPAGVVMEQRLAELFDDASAPGRGIQHMPMAVQPDADGVRRRTGPTTIFPPIGDPTLDPRFTLLTSAPAIRLRHNGGHVSGATVRQLGSGQEEEVNAGVTVVCADAIRTPQLLFASGIRPAALGRYLNEHAFVTGQVLLDAERFAVDLAALPRADAYESFTDSYWLPHSGPSQPFHWQIMNRLYLDDDTQPLAYSVGLTLYVPNEIQATNRLEFSPTDVDAAGMPRITVHFQYNDRDQELMVRGRKTHQWALEAFGPFDPDTQSAVLPAGSSLHFTGTVRMGAADDGTSVCDDNGGVWGFDNLYVAGNGVIPTALVCNSTLTGMTTAVRAARSVLSS